MIQHYCLGFLFDSIKFDARVVLIRKNKPAFQAGKLNGVGGHVEDDEGTLDAMEREFREETGMTVKDWRNVTSFSDNQTYVVHVFSAIGAVDSAKTTTDEPVSVHWHMNVSRHSVMENLEWLIPLCLAFERGQWGNKNLTSREENDTFGLK